MLPFECPPSEGENNAQNLPQLSTNLITASQIICICGFQERYWNVSTPSFRTQSRTLDQFSGRIFRYEVYPRTTRQVGESRIKAVDNNQIPQDQRRICPPVLYEKLSRPMGPPVEQTIFGAAESMGRELLSQFVALPTRRCLGLR